MALCTSLQRKVDALEKDKLAQATEILSLKKRVEKLEKRRKSKPLVLRRLRKIGSATRVESSEEASLGAEENASKQGGDIYKYVMLMRDFIVDETQKAGDDMIFDTTADLVEKIQKTIEASMVALAELYDAIQAQIDADQELAARMTLEEHEKYTVEERARMLAEFIKNRKKQLAVERAEAIRSKPPIKSQLRNLMMTYLKNTCRFTHGSKLNHRDFEEIRGLYNKEKELVDTFVAIGSKEDERRIKDLNTKAEEEGSNKDVDSKQIREREKIYADARGA
ncbi:hypothetical protein Tco_0863534 [Tanacetum coccineum]